MSCLVYIQKITSNPEHQQELQKVHDSIFTTIKKSNAFRKYNDLYFLPVNKAHYTRAKMFINNINRHYGTVVAGTDFTKATGKEYLFVNVKNIAQSVIDAYEDVKRKKLTQQIDDQGDSTPLYNRALTNVNFDFKVVNSISGSLVKINKLYDQLGNTDTFWNKIQQDLQIPKNQINLLKESEGSTIEEKLTSFVANYSYAVEINTTTDKVSYKIETYTEFDPDEGTYVDAGYAIYTPDSSTPKYIVNTKEEAERLAKKEKRPTQTYSSMVVPGGTNYTENEIATPAITPSIKGHAQFATDKSIGWFRSDDKEKSDKALVNGYFYYTENDGETTRFVKHSFSSYLNKNKEGKQYINAKEYGEAENKYNFSTKTRRILEVQSDLFQKGRDRFVLSKDVVDEFPPTEFEYKGIKYKAVYSNGVVQLAIRGNGIWNYLKESEIKHEKYDDVKTYIKNTFLKDKFRNTSTNKFLQLLNKDNNWVTFFVKSIVQDSAKKGYEKVLFPTGNTASKVEGHSTLEEFKKQKEDRIKELENKIKEINSDDFFDKTYFIHEKGIYKKKSMYDNPLIGGRAFIKDVNSKEEAKKIAYERVLKDSENEINQLKQELARVDKEGFGALKPIWNFYENTVKNILKKQGFEPREFKDEYGNTWNEIEIKATYLQPILFNRLPDLLQKQLQEDPDGFYSMVNDQLNNILPNGTQANTLLNEDAVIKQWGEDVVRNAKAWAFQNQLKIQNNSLGAVAMEQMVSELNAKLGVPYEIIDVQKAVELTKDSSFPYNGEPGFYLNNKVYLVKGKFDINTRLHEVIHPFIEALSKYNPDLFTRLYESLSGNKEYDNLFEYVSNLYPELAELAEIGKPNLFMKELLTYAIQKEATGQLNNIKPEHKSFLKRFWDALKYMLKSIFKPKISLDTLDSNTSISELTKLLLFSDVSIDLSGKDGLWNYVFPMYNRNFAEEVSKIQKDKFNEEIEKFYGLIKTHVNRLLTSKNLTEISKIFNVEDPKSDLRSAKELFGLAEKFITQVEDDEKKLTAFSEGIASLELSTKNMVNHIRTFIDRTDVDDKYKIGVLHNYGFIVKDWSKVITDFLDLTKGTEGPLRSTIVGIKDKFDQIENITGEYFKNTGLVNIFMDYVKDNEFINRGVKELEDEIEFLKKDYESGNKKVKKRLQEVYDLYQRAKPTEENFKKWLAGEMGDTNFMSTFWESYTSDPNIIVGGFANWFYNEKIRFDSKQKETNTKFLNKLSAVLKKFGLSKHNINEVFDKITDTVQELYIDKEGNDQKRTYRVFANQYAGDYQYRKDKYKYDLEKLEPNSEEYRVLYEESKKFELDYMFTDASDIVAKSNLFWSQSSSHAIAFSVRDAILTEIRLEQSKRVTDEERLEQEERLKLLWRRYSRLYSLKNEDGTDKDFNDQNMERNGAIASIFKEHREKFGDLYERKEIPGAFENARKIQEAIVEDNLINEGLEKDSEDYKKQFKSEMSKWLTQNMRITNTAKFYEDRQKLVDELKVLLEKLSPNEKAQIDITKEWEKLFDIIKGFRDDEGSVIGSDLSEKQQTLISEIEENIEKMRDTLMTKSGLTREENRQFLFLFRKLRSKETLTEDERNIYNELSEKKKSFSSNLTESEQKRVKSLFNELASFQTRIPTEYYVDKMVEYSNGAIDTNILFDEIPVGSIEHFFVDNPEFEEWFGRNHRLYTVYDKNGSKSVYRRTYAWSRVIPNDDSLADLIINNDYAGIMSYNSPYVEVIPNNNFTTYEIKDKYKTPKIVGVTVDNRNNFLPKPTKESATPEQRELMDKLGISYAKDSAFESKIFKELNSNPDMSGYKILNELYKDYHLKNQEGSDAAYTKLWYKVPMQRKRGFEAVKIKDIKEGVNNVFDFAKRINPFVKEEVEDAYTRDVDNWNPEEISKHIVMTDLWGETATNIPIKYTSYVEEENMSKDLSYLVMRYGSSVDANKFLRDTFPIANSLRSTLLKNKPVDTSKVAKTFLGLKLFRPKVKDSDKVASNMYTAVNNFIETFYEGKTKHKELGVGFERFSKFIMKNTAAASLALSPVAAVRNIVSGNIQKTLEGITGKFYSHKEILSGELEFDSKVIPALIKEAYSSEKGFYSQMFDLFDPLIEYDNKVGEAASKTLQQDMMNFKFLYSLQKGGELHVQGSTWMTMMKKPQIPYTDKNGEVRKIAYSDAWELKDGIIQLKEGIDPSWGKNGKNFAQFVLQMRKVNERLQGAYANENSSEAQRYTSLSLVLFMRKYFTPMFLNRFQFKRPNLSTGEMNREGYYITFFKTVEDTFRNGKANWHTYSQQEKLNIMKFFAEIGFSMGIALTVSLLGWDEDDEDKYDKLRNDWVRAYLIYQLLAIKSETETFIPWFGMGIDEWYRNITTPSVAFNTLGKYKKFITNTALLITGDEDAYYDKSYGVYEKGDIKALADFYKITGINKIWLMEDPTEGVKQYVQMARRY